MARKYFKLIGVDRSGNEHPVEVEGYSAGHAAQKLLEKDGATARVLNGDPHAKGKGNYYRKCILVRPGCEGSTGNTVMSAALSGTGLSVAQMILNQLKSRGMQLDVVDDQMGGESIVISPKGVATEADNHDIIEHQEALVTLIKMTNGAQHHDERAKPADLGRGLSRRKILEKMLPQLPSPFMAPDLQERLRGCGYSAFADDATAIANCLSAGHNLGLITRLQRGRYEVSPQFRRPPLSPPVEAPAEEAPPTPPQKPGDPLRVAAEALFEKPIPKPVEQLPLVETPAPPSQIKPAIVPPPTAPPAGAVNVTDALAFLASIASVGLLTDEQIVAFDNGIKAFEEKMQQALIDLETIISPIMQTLRNYSAASAQFRALITKDK